MKVLHIAPSLYAEWGGPAKVVTDLAEALSKKGAHITIFAPVEENKAGAPGKLEHVDVKLFPKSFLSRSWTSYSPALAKALMEQISEFDLIHIHEIWHYPHFAAYRAAKFAKKPFIITIHGQLEPWCLNHKAFKKKIYSLLVQRRILEKASALHALTEGELKNVSNFVHNSNMVLIPNGLNVEEYAKLPQRERTEILYPELRGKKVILFLGRIHPVKGLDMLARAFKGIREKRDDIHLVIAGLDSYDHKSEIVDILKSDEAVGSTTFTGIVTGNRKLAILSRADIFVLPSHSEGFSMSSLEAMACGLPLVITKQCNFPEVEQRGAGRVIDPDTDSLAKALMGLLDHPDLCNQMGQNGKRLVEEKFTWDSVADKMIAAYEEILITAYHDQHKLL
jgi:glycosyltransferase involved in cell wall biosynthesis